LKKLSEVAGVTVNFYDVGGAPIPQLHDRLQKHGPRDPKTREVSPATSSWSIGSAIKWSKTGAQCKLTGVTLRFTATADLPRLSTGVNLPEPVRASWNHYVAALEDRQAAKLAFVRDRIGEVERAIMRSNCGNWEKAAAAAIKRLGEDQAAAFKPDPKTQPKLSQPNAE